MKIDNLKIVNKITGKEMETEIINSEFGGKNYFEKAVCISNPLLVNDALNLQKDGILTSACITGISAKYKNEYWDILKINDEYYHLTDLDEEFDDNKQMIVIYTPNGYVMRGI